MDRLPDQNLTSLFPHAAFDVVVIAASMGGMEALCQILPLLPPDYPAAVIVQTHLNPTKPSYLVDILMQHSTLPIAWATDRAVLRPGTVTVAPPGQHVQVSPSTLTLTSWDKLEYQRPKADRLFESVAVAFKARAIGVVLTGYLSDGARGVQAIHRHGGRVLVQHPGTAQAASMPLAALRTGSVDFALSLRGLAAALITLVMVPGAAQFFTAPEPPLHAYHTLLRTGSARRG
jgi:two-component system, chemotaxis family, protein-glutamate methylesterase/glutaminase